MESSFMSTFNHIWNGVLSLLYYDLDFPPPIGEINVMEGLMFFGIAYILADAVRIVASRGD